MTYEQIGEIVKRNQATALVFEIRFKARSAIKGKFIRTSDFTELQRKNLWRIVSETHLENYLRTKDENLARIFNGTDITKLELVNG